LFLQQEESVARQEALARHFPDGVGTSTVIVAPADMWQQVAEVARTNDGVDRVQPDTGAEGPVASDAEPREVDGLIRLQVTLADAADSAAMTRVREESERLGTRPGVLKGLIVTGGVITSAGVVLAATFSALGVIRCSSWRRSPSSSRSASCSTPSWCAPSWCPP
jgi:hypothetical protein